METGNLLKKIPAANPELLAYAGIIVLAALARIVPHPANFAPIGALALFSGANIKSGKSIALPLLAMLVSDAVIGFHPAMPFVYGSFAAIYFIGRLIGKKPGFARLIFFASLSSVVFYLVTNFGAFLASPIYAKNLLGLENAYVMGIPFFRNTLLGDLFYTAAFFYGYRFISVRLTVLFARKVLSGHDVR